MLRWLLQASAGTPVTLDWLTPHERLRAAAFRFEKRRRDWLLGRYAAKRLVVRHLREETGLPVPLSLLEIGTEASGSPFARLSSDAPPVAGIEPGRRIPVSLSISHSAGRSLVALARGDGSADAAVAVGADVERVEPRLSAFADDYFTSEELATVSAGGEEERDRIVTTIWSAKEAVLKALGLGLTVDTRSVGVDLDPARTPPPPGLSPLEPEWTPFGVTAAPALLHGSTIHGFTRTSGGFVLTLALRLSAAEGSAREDAVAAGSVPEKG